MAERIFYRIVSTNPPTAAQFSSRAARGTLIEEANPQFTRLHEGISVYDSEEGARRLVRNRLYRGRYLAEIRIPDESGILWEKTLGPGHYTLWGDAQAIAACVTRVVPV